MKAGSGAPIVAAMTDRLNQLYGSSGDIDEEMGSVCVYVCIYISLNSAIVWSLLEMTAIRGSVLEKSRRGFGGGNKHRHASEEGGGGGGESAAESCKVQGKSKGNVACAIAHDVENFQWNPDEQGRGVGQRSSRKRSPLAG